jgi:hypothetical protein
MLLPPFGPTGEADAGSAQQRARTRPCRAPSQIARRRSIQHPNCCPAAAELASFPRKKVIAECRPVVGCIENISPPEGNLLPHNERPGPATQNEPGRPRADGRGRRSAHSNSERPEERPRDKLSREEGLTITPRSSSWSSNSQELPLSSDSRPYLGCALMISSASFV